MIDAFIRVFNGFIYLLEGVQLFFRNAGFWDILVFFILITLLLLGLLYLFWKIFEGYTKHHLEDYYLKQLNDKELTALVENNPNKVLIEQLHKIATYLRADINHDIFTHIDAQKGAYSNYENVVTSLKESLLSLASRIDHVYQNSQEELSTTKSLKSQYQNLTQQLDEKKAIIEDYKKGFLYAHFKTLVENILSIINQLEMRHDTLGDTADDLINLFEINVLKPLNVEAFTPEMNTLIDPRSMRALPDSKMAPEIHQQELIYDVVGNGYRLIEGDVQRIIKYATVRAYKLNPQFENHEEFLDAEPNDIETPQKKEHEIEPLDREKTKDEDSTIHQASSEIEPPHE